MTTLQTLLATLSSVALAATATPQENLDVAIHGFFSQGYLRSSDNSYLVPRTTEGSFGFSEAALNFGVQPVEGLRIGAQLFARNLGTQGNHRVTVDWALGDYRIKNWLGIRAGRLKLPIGLYNTMRDVDMARAEILQPSAIYPLSLRDLQAAFDGASLYGTVRLGGGSVEYEAFIGAQEVSEVAVVDRFGREGAEQIVSNLERFGAQDVRYSFGSATADQEITYGLALVLRPGIPGLRLGASYIYSETTVASDAIFTAQLGRVPVPISFITQSESTFGGPDSFNCVGSVEYQRGDLRLVAEYLRNRQIVNTTVTGIPGPPTPPIESRPDGEAFYVQGVYRFSDLFQAQAYYSAQWPDRDDRDGERYGPGGQSEAWLKDFALTARFDIKRNWLLKAEFHRFDGTSNLSPLDNRDGVVEDWSLFALKTTFFF